MFRTNCALENFNSKISGKHPSLLHLIAILKEFTQQFILQRTQILKERKKKQYDADLSPYPKGV